ncbi:MAG: hypothetical protein IT450_18070 [Phycisphaerales bacterium]|nr:hypothetical protein [Phycisphaerales bacterium]
MSANETVTAETSRLLTVAKAAYAADVAVTRSLRMLEHARKTGAAIDTLAVVKLLLTAGAALGQIPGQLNWYVPADSPETTAEALATYKLEPLQ